MAVSLDTALPPVSTSGRYGTGSSESVQTAPATPDQTPSKINKSGFVPSQTGTSGADETRKAPSSDQLAQAVKQVNDAFSQKGQNLYASFEKDQITGIHVVKIVEKKTNEIIRQMPPKEIVAFAQSIDAAQEWRGRLLLDKA